MLFNLLQTDTLVQAAEEAVEQVVAAPAAQPAEMSESLFSMFKMGGPLMWVLLVLSIIAIYIIGRKWWSIRQASKIDPNFMNDIQSAVENTGNIEVSRLEKGLPILATIAGGAPMIGFLGTVLGMVKAFFNMSKAGNNIDITLLSDGIYTAMLTTVGGLIVGIIAYFGYNWLTSKVSNLVYKMESSSMEFIDIVLHEPGEE